MLKQTHKKHIKRALEKFNEFARESHAKHVKIFDRDGKHIMHFPLTLGVAGFVILPIVASIGIIVFFLNEYHATFEKMK